MLFRSDLPDPENSKEKEGIKVMYMDKKSLRENRLAALQEFICDRTEEINILEQNGYTREQAIEMLKLQGLEGIETAVYSIS